jgi:cob(I)alamin adenosyltransferase
MLHMSIATKTGDDGTTGLMFGHRVPKTDTRIEANGTLDELNASLGMVRATVADPFITDKVFAIQKELITLMGELGVSAEDRERYANAGFAFVTIEMVDRLTAHIDDLEQNHRINFQKWATPGDTLGSAALDVARTVCRRAERRVLALAQQTGDMNAEILRYLNRLSDLCWLWARFVETKASS